MNGYNMIVSSIKELEWSEEFKGHKEMVISFMKRFYTINEYPVSVTYDLDKNQILFQGKSWYVRIFEPKADGTFETVRILVDKTKEVEFVAPQFFVCSWEGVENEISWRYFDGTVKGNRHLQMIEELLVLMDNMKQALEEGKDFSPTSVISVVTNTLGITEDELVCYESPVLTIHDGKIVDAKKRQGSVMLEQERTDCIICRDGNFEMVENEPKQRIDKVELTYTCEKDCLTAINTHFSEGRKAIINFLQEIALYNLARK